MHLAVISWHFWQIQNYSIYNFEEICHEGNMTTYFITEIHMKKFKTDQLSALLTTHE